jgi:hypothetical protein
MKGYLIYKGNCPSGTLPTASYILRFKRKHHVVALCDRTSGAPRWFDSIDDHPSLVAMVLAAFRACEASLDNAFYINEYQQVLVPSGSARCILAGEYPGTLHFENGTRQWSADVVSVRPGDQWPGPPVGMPYVLDRSNGDIYYRSAGGTGRVLLSTAVGSVNARAVTSSLCSALGQVHSHPFLVNERSHTFAPTRSAKTPYVYLGRIDVSSAWFPNPALSLRGQLLRQC